MSEKKSGVEPKKVSTPEENEQARKDAIAKAKDRATKDKRNAREKQQGKILAASGTSAKLKAERAEGETEEFTFAANFKCDGVFYKSGNTYNLPPAIAKLAIESGVINQ